jgi:hypothetical protein
MSDKICFVIAPIGQPESETRKRSDQVLKHVIRPAVAERHFKAIRADEISEPGIITSQVIQHVVDSPLVVADLTGRNPNVFYELAVRHALRKPLVQIINRGDAIPFDVAGMRTIPVDHRDLDSVEEARKEIVKQVDASDSMGDKVETPISVAVELQSLRQSDDPGRRSLADVLSGIADLRSSISGLEKQLADPAALLPPDYLVYLLRRLGPSSSWSTTDRELLERVRKIEEEVGYLSGTDAERLFQQQDRLRKDLLRRELQRQQRSLSGKEKEEKSK